MYAKLQRRLVLFFVLAAVPILVASAAFACQRLVTAYATPKSGPVGTNVTVTGGNYNPSAGPVEVRLDTRTGKVLATTAAQPDGNISVTFPIPSGTSVGYHTLVVTQFTSSGTMISGGPGRTSFQVTQSATKASAGGIFTTPLAVGFQLTMAG
ncbi:MAG: hypothetical protein M3252_01355, partial [Actinomycetota bacterium]|nr:hypothetical protein [Actinomycetota bacterium]